MITILRTHRFATLAFSVALLGVLAGAGLGWTRQQRRQPVRDVNAPKIASRTPSVRIVSSNQTVLGDTSFVVVKLENTTDKDIKSYSIGSGKSWMTRNYVLTDESFAAGSTIDQMIPLQSQDMKIALTDFTVAAVLFADGTSDGLPVFASRLTELHKGMRDQASRILPCLQGSSSKKLAACESEANNLPTKLEGKSPDYADGLEHVRRKVLSELSDIKEKSRTSFTEASEKQEKVTRILGELTLQ